MRPRQPGRCGSSRTGPTGDVAEYTRQVRARRATRISSPGSRSSSSKCSPATPRSSPTCSTCAGVEIGPYRVLRCESPAVPERDRRPAAAHPRSHRQGAARLLRLDRRQPDRLPAQVPGVRRGRHRAGQARGAAAGRARPRTASAHPRRLTRYRCPCRRVRPARPRSTAARRRCCCGASASCRATRLEAPELGRDDWARPDPGRRVGRGGEWPLGPRVGAHTAAPCVDRHHLALAARTRRRRQAPHALHRESVLTGAFRVLAGPAGLGWSSDPLMDPGALRPHQEAERRYAGRLDPPRTAC